MAPGEVGTEEFQEMLAATQVRPLPVNVAMAVMDLTDGSKAIQVDVNQMHGVFCFFLSAEDADSVATKLHELAEKARSGLFVPPNPGGLVVAR